jgi:hypothetical protein
MNSLPMTGDSAVFDFRMSFAEDEAGPKGLEFVDALNRA